MLEAKIEFFELTFLELIHQIGENGRISPNIAADSVQVERVCERDHFEDTILLLVKKYWLNKVRIFNIRSIDACKSLTAIVFHATKLFNVVSSPQRYKGTSTVFQNSIWFSRNKVHWIKFKF